MNFLENRVVGVVGCGSMGRRRIKYAQHLGCKHIYLHDIRKDRMEECEEDFGGKACISLTEFLRKEIEILFICVPPSSHFEYMEYCAENNIHFMVEQPISHLPKGLAELREKIAENNLIVHVSSNKSFHPAIKKIKELIEKNTVGKILSGLIEIGEWLPDWHPYEPYTDYYPSSKSKGGGLDAVCEIQWLNELFGYDAKILCVADKVSELEIDTDDLTQFIIRYSEGPQIILHADMLQRVYSHRVKFIGAYGTILWDLDEGEIKVYSKEIGKWEKIAYGSSNFKNFGPMQGKENWGWVEEMYYFDTLYFVQKIINDETNLCSFDNGVCNLKAVYEGIKQN